MRGRMRIGLLADIHGNLPALEAVLRTLKSTGVDAIVVAGDTIGYGPFPNECIDAVRASTDLVVAGNHELFLVGEQGDAHYGQLAVTSLLWTKVRLRQPQWDWLNRLPRQAELANVVVTHGSLASPHEYIVRPRQAAHQLELLRRTFPAAEALVLGHTHAPTYMEDGHRAPLGPLRRRRYQQRILINPGSVGQSRQRERWPRARFAVLDAAAHGVTWYAVPYDHGETLRALREAGLPAVNVHFRPAALVALARAARRRTDIRLNAGGRNSGHGA